VIRTGFVLKMMRVASRCDARVGHAESVFERGDPRRCGTPFLLELRHQFGGAETFVTRTAQGCTLA
jgi:hypothetical protein